MSVALRTAAPAAIGVLVVLAVAVLALSPKSEDVAPGGSSPVSPRERAVAGMLAHLGELQRIADEHGGNRAAGTPGYRASVAYVTGRLRAAGYVVTVQRMRFPYFGQRAPPRVQIADTPVSPAGLRTMSYSGAGTATGTLREIDPRRGERGERDAGCIAADFAGLPGGAVALVERGTCSLRLKVDNARRAGAGAAIVFNDGRPGREGAVTGSLGSPGAGIPAVSASYAVGRRLAGREGSRVRVVVRAVSGRRTTSNVLADLPGTGVRPVVMAGAHLDSVADGPGINDNGSGVAALLEAARSLAPQPGERQRRGVRFAFWGAEELGLIGSRHYVRGLGPGERRRIAVYLNLDMVGSRNAGRFVYFSDEGARAARVARRVLAQADVRLLEIEIGAASDHAPFEDAGVPVLGLFSGHSEVKTAKQQRLWGGRAGRTFDRCYHQACDTAERVNRTALVELGTGAAETLRALMSARLGMARKRLGG